MTLKAPTRETLCLAAILALGGVEALRPPQDSAVAVELRELRRELVEITKTLVVAVQELKEHDRRIGKLETDRLVLPKNGRYGRD